MNKLIKIVLRFTSCYFCSFALLMAPTSGLQAKLDNMAFIEGLAGGFMNFQKMKQDQQQQLFQQQQLQQMQQQNIQRHNAEMLEHGQTLNALRPKVIPSRYFPNCPISQSQTPTVDGNCEVAQTRRTEDQIVISESFTDFEKAKGWKQLANSYIGFFEEIMSVDQNSNVPKGLQCLHESREQLNSNIIDRMNYLKGVMTDLNKNTQQFRDESIAILNQIKNHNAMLDGSGNLKKHDLPGKFKTVFGNNACKDSLRGNELTGIGGLNALRQKFADREVFASQYSSSAKSYRDDLNAIAGEIEKNVEEVGIQEFLAESGTNVLNTRQGLLTNFAAINSAKEYEKKRLNNRTKILKKQLADVGIRDLELSTGFNDKVADYTEERLYNQFYSQCVRSPSSFGMGGTASINELLASVRMPNAGPRNTTVRSYRAKAKELLRKFNRGSSSAYDGDWLYKQLKDLDSSYRRGAIGVVRLNPKTGRQEYNPVSRYFNGLLANCKKAMKDTSRTATPQAKQLDQALDAIKEMKKIKQRFAGNMSQSVKRMVLNCNGAKYQPGGVFCSEKNIQSGILSPQHPKFCIPHANKCARSVLKCNEKITNEITKHISARAVAATRYNKRVESLVSAHNAEVQKLNERVKQDLEFLKGYFPGANFNLPQDLFVPMPEPVETSLGVDLRGGTNVHLVMDAASKQINKLVKVIDEQRDNVMAAVNRYIDGQRTKMQENYNKWTELHKKCSEFEKRFIESENEKENARLAAIKDQQQKAQEQQLEQKTENDSTVTDFCTRFGKFRRNAGYENPGPACDIAEALYDDIGKVNRLVSRDAIASVEEFYNYCHRIQSEAEYESDRDDDDDDIAPPSFAEKCAGSDEGSQDLFDELIERFVKNRLDALDTSKTQFEDAINSKSALESIRKKVGSSDYRNIKFLHELKNKGEDIKINSHKAIQYITEAKDEEKDIRRKGKLAKLGEIVTADLEKYKKDEDLCHQLRRDRISLAVSACLDSSSPDLCYDDKKDIDVAKTYSTDSKIKDFYTSSRSVASTRKEEDSFDVLSRLGEEIDGIQCENISSNQNNGFDNFNNGAFTGNPSDTSGLRDILHELDGLGR